VPRVCVDVVSFSSRDLAAQEERVLTVLVDRSVIVVACGDEWPSGAPAEVGPSVVLPTDTRPRVKQARDRKCREVRTYIVLPPL
jgi:hypothetical protein